jgi:hypothetical protein
VVRIYPLLGNGCVFCAVVRPEAIYEKTTIIDSSVSSARIGGEHKKVQPLHFYQRRNNERRKKDKSLDVEQMYGHGSQRGSMPGVTVLAGCRQ